MRFDVLGFAGAAPLEGACSSYVVSTKDTTLLLDCGPGTLERLWQRELLGRIDAIVLSHMHADHVLDLVPFSGEVAAAAVARRLLLTHLLAGTDGAELAHHAGGAFDGPIDLAHEGWTAQL
jgi:ribonuclease BN (tRNA processing enzyme)